MTETSTAVDRGSQDWNTVVRSARGSLERRTCGGMVRPRDLVIFCKSSGSLEYKVSGRERNSDEIMQVGLRFK